tara:strand:- start:15321 stop:17117 length:1797 start_codon:yes stop_codon:yes gene_type:complete
MDNLHLIQLNQYERPTITEERNKNYVSIGDNNDYYQNLIDCYMDSTTNQAVINGVVNQIYGKGLDATDSNKKPEQYAQMKSLIKNDCLRKVCQDLKLLGEASFQVTYTGNKISAITHFPRETLRAEKMNDKGEIKNYYYAPDWSKVQRNSKLKKFPVFGSGAQNEIYIVKRYVTGFYYYSPADYNTAYATLESEISGYLINMTQNSFSGTKVVNFNNGVPDREKQLAIKNDVMQKLTGSYGEKVIVAFNNNAESKTTVEDIPLDNAPQHYEYLSSECSKKIMLTHRVTSPLLIGLRDGNNGLGNNADEIQNASRLFNNVVIQPYQNLLIDSIDEMLAVNDISLNLYFKTIEPLEFMDLEDIDNAEVEEEQTGIKDEETELELMAANSKRTALDELIDLGIDEEELLKDYEMVHSAEVDYDLEEELDFVVTEINKTSKKEFASTGSAKPYRESEQDGTSKKKTEEGTEFLVRYMYEAAPNPASSSRTFCDKMMAAKKVYRKEDIIEMGKKPVNAGFGKGGSDTYSIWLYKGGARCNHRWTRKLYARKGGRSLGEAISTTQAIKRGFRPETNAKKVSIAPKNMKYAGYTAAYWNKKGFVK